MWKFGILVCLCLHVTKASIVKRQAENEGSGVTGLSVGLKCFAGRNTNYTEAYCPENERMCMTTLQLNNGVSEITKQCKQPEACTAHETENSNQCTGFEALTNEVSICHFCCIGDLCNALNTITELKAAHEILSRINIET
uniref:UPAR/Ly6 domain-containing protein n=1 Tax=Ciona savignyi TaxID=51511 RepID=H2Z6K9_CIOSA